MPMKVAESLSATSTSSSPITRWASATATRRTVAVEPSSRSSLSRAPSRRLATPAAAAEMIRASRSADAAANVTAMPARPNRR